MSIRGRIEQALASIAQLTAGSGAPWIVGGSAGLMLRGAVLTSEPRDLDLYTDEADVDRLHALLQPFSTDIPVLDETGIYRSRLSHYLIDDVPVELVGGFVVRAHDSCYETQVRSLLLPYAQQVTVGRGGSAPVATVSVVPLAHELWFNVLRDRPDRYELIIEAYCEDEARHKPALEQLESRNQLSAALKAEVRRWIAEQRVGQLI
ncbi:hypothetical protein SAMN04487969_10976 [Paenibacillus algorifonticola]|uniref:Nucleotidyl transferase AbiEii toxin, Type IV TA system n=1 Tax=Paenibacillus algorifonticola TaxID=684063 RepID=A0A1I2EFY6_9BACL|nr:hypothetical protein [Paenibacillus algorifonticola]SFE91557.1 hypothetical protein SAMN04487969_10976 [Paenibacillus algorifonticola]